jgi:hypothetical protein
MSPIGAERQVMSQIKVTPANISRFEEILWNKEYGLPPAEQHRRLRGNKTPLKCAY